MVDQTSIECQIDPQVTSRSHLTPIIFISLDAEFPLFFIYLIKNGGLTWKKKQVNLHLTLKGYTRLYYIYIYIYMHTFQC